MTGEEKNQIEIEQTKRQSHTRLERRTQSKRPLSYSRSLPTRSSHPATTRTKAIRLLESFHSNAHIFKASHSVAHEQRTLSKGEELVRDSQKSWRFGMLMLELHQNKEVWKAQPWQNLPWTKSVLMLKLWGRGKLITDFTSLLLSILQIIFGNFLDCPAHGPASCVMQCTPTSGEQCYPQSLGFASINHHFVFLRSTTLGDPQMNPNVGL